MIFRHLRRAAAHRGGNVAMITAFAAVPIAIAVGASIDLADSYRQKEKLQSATDAAALAAARVLMAVGTKQEAEAAARNYLAANTKGLPSAPTVTTLTVNVAAGSVILTTKIIDDVAFGGFLGKQTVPLTVTTHTKGAGQTMEVALVLDNSGSMGLGTGRIEALRKASEKFVTILYEDTIVRKKTSIAVVPFSSSVNVGAGNANASWIDKGTAAIHAENLDRYGDTQAPEAKRQSVYAALRSSWAWKGCVESRKPGTANLDVTDVEAQSGSPDTLFTPMFAPDEPDVPINPATTLSYYANNYLLDDNPTYAERSRDCVKQGNQNKWKCNYDAYSKNGTSSIAYTGSSNRTYTTETNPNGRIWTSGAQCTGAEPNTYPGRQKRTCKYKAGGFPTLYGAGPNYMCDSEPILPLTALQTGKDTLVTKVKSLPANGGTNILEGLMWGWRVLSQAQPFDQGREPGAPDNRKIMVVMTDGMNTMYGSHSGETMNKTWYSSYGYGSNGRLKDMSGAYGVPGENAELSKAVSDRMAIACENAKDAGITIYTVILTSESEGETTNWTAAKKLMKDCASEPDDEFYYAPKNVDELEDDFERIAKSIRKIHLSH